MTARVAIVCTVAMAILGVVAVLAFAPRSSSSSSADDTNPTSFNLPALVGSGRVSLASFRGEPVVVDLFASWCTECQTELPAFAAEAAALRGRVQFIGVNSLETGDGVGMAEQYHLASSGFVLAHDVGPGGGGLHDALKAPGMPVTVFYDTSGRIVGRDIASIPRSTLIDQLHTYYGV